MPRHEHESSQGIDKLRYASPTSEKTALDWRDFVHGPVYADEDAPWRNDPAFSLLQQFPGLRDSIGGRVGVAVQQAIGLVRALAQVDLLALMDTRRPAEGLCLGFGQNVEEPCDLLQALRLDRLHAYEWIAEHVIEAGRLLAARTSENPSLLARIRLYHGTISDLSTLADASMRVIYVGNVFTREVPMSEETFAGAVREMLRVLEGGGVVISRGSSGDLERALQLHGQMLVDLPLVSVFQKGI
jgi:hypothetical protein